MIWQHTLVLVPVGANEELSFGEELTEKTAHACFQPADGDDIVFVYLIVWKHSLKLLSLSLSSLSSQHSNTAQPVQTLFVGSSDAGF